MFQKLKQLTPFNQVPFANIVAIAAQVWWVTGGSVNVVSNHCREVAPYLCFGS
jgi:hypothetical protein